MQWMKEISVWWVWSPLLLMSNLLYFIILVLYDIWTQNTATTKLWLSYTSLLVFPSKSSQLVNLSEKTTRSILNFKDENDWARVNKYKNKNNHILTTFLWNHLEMYVFSELFTPLKYFQIFQISFHCVEIINNFELQCSHYIQVETFPPSIKMKKLFISEWWQFSFITTRSHVYRLHKYVCAPTSYDKLE